MTKSKTCGERSRIHDNCQSNINVYFRKILRLASLAQDDFMGGVL
jgi:hypothetical protein